MMYTSEHSHEASWVDFHCLKMTAADDRGLAGKNNGTWLLEHQYQILQSCRQPIQTRPPAPKEIVTYNIKIPVV